MASGLVKGLTEICISCDVHASALGDVAAKAGNVASGTEFSTNHFCFRTFGVDIVTFKRSSLSNQLENVVFNFTIVQSHCLTFSFIQMTIFVISKDRQRFFSKICETAAALQRHKTIFSDRRELTQV